MNKYKVAILLRPDKTAKGTRMFCVPQKILSLLSNYSIEAELISLQPEFDYFYEEYFNGNGPIINLKDYEKLKNKVLNCDGLFLTGGDEFYYQEIKLVRDMYSYKFPIFGICLGMQTIVKAFGGVCKKLPLNLINNHKDGTIHEVILNDKSSLYNLSFKLRTNSYHKHHMLFDENNLLNKQDNKTILYITGKSKDGVIEMVESVDGIICAVQYHPEHEGLMELQINGGSINIVFISDITNTLIKNFIIQMKKTKFYRKKENFLLKNKENEY